MIKELGSKYPKYSRKEKKSCKLLDEDILEIRKLYATGEYSKNELGRMFSVSSHAITYWLLTKQERKALNKKNYQEYPVIYSKEQREISYKKFYDRKKLLKGEELSRFNTKKLREYFNSNGEIIREKKREKNRTLNKRCSCGNPIWFENSRCGSCAHIGNTNSRKYIGCKIENCKEKHSAKGFCKSHYNQNYRNTHK